MTKARTKRKSPLDYEFVKDRLEGAMDANNQTGMEICLPTAGSRKRVITTDDGYYTMPMIEAWEHPQMFRTAREWCIYELLRNYCFRLHIRVFASSCIDALNILKEAAIALAGSGSLNRMFEEWLHSCYNEFIYHCEAVLTTNRPS